MPPISVLCNNCRWNATNVELSKLNNKCPRCGSGMFNRTELETEIDQPETGDNSPDVRGKPLAS